MLTDEIKINCLKELLNNDFKDLHKTYLDIATVVIALDKKKDSMDSLKLKNYLEAIKLKCSYIKTEYLNNNVIFKNYENPLINIFLFKLDDLLNSMILYITKVLVRTDVLISIKSNLNGLILIAREIKYLEVDITNRSEE